MDKPLHILHELLQKGNLVGGGSGVKGDLSLPRDSRTVSTRAKGAVMQDGDVEFARKYICQAAL